MCHNTYCHSSPYSLWLIHTGLSDGWRTAQAGSYLNNLILAVPSILCSLPSNMHMAHFSTSFRWLAKVSSSNNIPYHLTYTSTFYRFMPFTFFSSENFPFPEIGFRFMHWYCSPGSIRVDDSFSVLVTAVSSVPQWCWHVAVARLWFIYCEWCNVCFQVPKLKQVLNFYQ